MSRPVRDSGLGATGPPTCQDVGVLQHLRARSAAVVVALVAIAGTVATGVLDASVTSAHRAVLGQDVGWTAAVSGLALVLPGALLLARLPRHPVAWVLVLGGL